MKPVLKMFIYVRKLYKPLGWFMTIALFYGGFIYAKKIIINPDFGESFGSKALLAEKNWKACMQILTSVAMFAMLTPHL